MPNHRSSTSFRWNPLAVFLLALLSAFLVVVPSSGQTEIGPGETVVCNSNMSTRPGFEFADVDIEQIVLFSRS